MQDPIDRTVSALSRTLATSRLNPCIRNRGLSARDMWSQRDQFSNNHIPLADLDLITKQHAFRTANHKYMYSENSKPHLGDNHR